MDCGLGCTEAVTDNSCCGSQAPVSSNHGLLLPNLKHERLRAGRPNTDALPTLRQHLFELI